MSLWLTVEPGGGASKIIDAKRKGGAFPLIGRHSRKEGQLAERRSRGEGYLETFPEKIRRLYEEGAAVAAEARLLHHRTYVRVVAVVPDVVIVSNIERRPGTRRPTQYELRTYASIQR